MIDLATPPPAAGHNSDMAAFHHDVDELGQQAGTGSSALSRLATRVMQAARDNLVQPSDATMIYERYRMASSNAGGTVGSVKSNASKLKQLIQLAVLHDSVKLVSDAERARNEVEKPKQPLEALVAIARVRLQARGPLTDVQVTAAVSKPPKSDKPKSKPQANTDEADWQAVDHHVNVLVTVHDRTELETAVAIRDKLSTYIASFNTMVEYTEPLRAVAEVLNQAVDDPPSVDANMDDDATAPSANRTALAEVIDESSLVLASATDNATAPSAAGAATTAEAKRKPPSKRRTTSG